MCWRDQDNQPNLPQPSRPRMFLKVRQRQKERIENEYGGMSLQELAEVVVGYQERESELDAKDQMRYDIAKRILEDRSKPPF